MPTRIATRYGQRDQDRQTRAQMHPRCRGRPRPLVRFGAMLSIRAATSAQYYEQPASSPATTTTPRRGAGAGAVGGPRRRALGLAGRPRARASSSALLEGRHPRAASRLAPARRRTRNAGFDLTFTAPKSVSVLLGGRRRAAVREAVIAAHEKGVAPPSTTWSATSCHARRGHAGASDRAAPQGFAGAAYTHEMSRSGDPHLHTHLVIANLVRGQDGRYTRARHAPGLRRRQDGRARSRRPSCATR